MRKTILTSFLFISSFVMAQYHDKKNEILPDKVPSEVRASFHKDFPTAANVWWEKENGNFESNFKIDQQAMEASYTKSGYRKKLNGRLKKANCLRLFMITSKKNIPVMF
jgi:hypothetical protein